jgi:hypothetical protein
MDARITATLGTVGLMLTTGCSGENGPIDMTVTAGTAGGTEGAEGPDGADETGAGDFPGNPFTFHIEETTNYHASHLLSCTNTDLNQIGIRLRNAMEADGFVGDYRLNVEGRMTHFVDSTEQPGLGEDDQFADTARVTVYAGHGNINSMQWGDPGTTGECSIDIAEQMRLGTLAGDISAFGMYVTSCTANVNSLTGTLGISQAGQHVGWHNSPAVPDSIPATFYEQTGTSIVDGDNIVPVHNREAWLAIAQTKPGFGENSPVVYTTGATVDEVVDRHFNARLAVGIGLDENIPEPQAEENVSWVDNGDCP